MNTERVKAAREALENMDDYARMNTGVDAIGPRKVLEAFIAEAERATQPAQDQVDAALESAVQAVMERVGDNERIHLTSAFEAIRSIKKNRLAPHGKQEPVAAARAAPETHSARRIITQLETAERGFICPLCGKDFPHGHTPAEISIYRNGFKAAIHQQELIGAEHQGVAEDARVDSGAVSTGGGAGSNECNEHRGRKSENNRSDGGSDGAFDGVQSSGEVRKTVVAPSPQPELSGNIDTPKADPVVDRWALEKAICAGEVDPEHCVYKRSDVVEIIKLLRTAAPAPQPQPGGGIDSNQYFGKLLSRVAEYGFDGGHDNALIEFINAWKDAACVSAVMPLAHGMALIGERLNTDENDGSPTAILEAIEQLHAGWTEQIGKTREANQRATDAKAKLAAIREGVATMICWVTTDDGELCQSVEKAAGIQDPEQAMVRLSSLLTLLRPPSQSDSSDQPGEVSAIPLTEE